MIDSMADGGLPVFGDSQDAAWIGRVREAGAFVHEKYFDRFSPVSGSEIEGIEAYLGRSFPADYKRFLMEIGAGQFPGDFGGGFDTPGDLFDSCGAAVYFFTGTAWNTDVSREEHLRLYRSHGADNPRPDVFTDDVLTHDGVSLLDLVHIGSDGSCCYHALHVGRGERPFGYVLASDSQEFEDPEATFADGLRRIMLHHLEAINEDYGDPG